MFVWIPVSVLWLTIILTSFRGISLPNANGRFLRCDSNGAFSCYRLRSVAFFSSVFALLSPASVERSSALVLPLFSSVVRSSAFALLPFASVVTQSPPGCLSPHLQPSDSNHDLPHRLTHKFCHCISPNRILISFVLSSRCFLCLLLIIFSLLALVLTCLPLFLHHELSLFLFEFLRFMFPPFRLLRYLLFHLMCSILLCLCRLSGCLPVFLYPSFYLPPQTISCVVQMCCPSQ